MLFFTRCLCFVITHRYKMGIKSVSITAFNPEKKTESLQIQGPQLLLHIENLVRVIGLTEHLPGVKF